MAGHKQPTKRAPRAAGAWAKARPAPPPPRASRLSRLLTAPLTRFGAMRTARAATRRSAAPLATQPEPADLDVDLEETLPAERVPGWVWLSALLLCLLGVADASYLTVAHYTTSTILACSDKGFVNCTKVTTSPESVIFGIPVAVLGLVYFVAMLPLQLPFVWRSPRSVLRYLRLAGVITGVGMVAYLIYTELFTLKTICLFCTGVHVVTVLLFLVVMIGTALLPRSDDAQLDPLVAN